MVHAAPPPPGCSSKYPGYTGYSQNSQASVSALTKTCGAPVYGVPGVSGITEDTLNSGFPLCVPSSCLAALAGKLPAPRCHVLSADTSTGSRGVLELQEADVSWIDQTVLQFLLLLKLQHQECDPPASDNTAKVVAALEHTSATSAGSQENADLVLCNVMQREPVVSMKPMQNTYERARWTFKHSFN